MTDKQPYFIAPNRGFGTEADTQMLKFREELRNAGIEVADNVRAIRVDISFADVEAYKRKYPALHIEKPIEHQLA